MKINILHIDDELDILQKASQIITGTKLGEFELIVKDSCGFEEGMSKLKENEYDLVILDLCVGKASLQSDKIGDSIFRQIKERTFIPVVFFTGLPDYVRSLSSEIVRVASKAEGYDNLFHEIKLILELGVIELKNEVLAITKEGLRSYFWEFVHPNVNIIASMKHDQTSIRYLLLRRLGKNLSSQVLKDSLDDSGLKKGCSHPMEFYIYPAIEGEYEAGDIIRSRRTGEISVILTPTCDLVIRENGQRNAEKILIVHTIVFTDTPDYKKMKALQDNESQIKASGKSLSDKDVNQVKNSVVKTMNMMRPGQKERFFFLPPTHFLKALLIDFQSKSSISYNELESDHEIVATLDDPIAQAVLSSYSRYYSRIGYQDLDIEYTFNKINS